MSMIFFSKYIWFQGFILCIEQPTTVPLEQTITVPLFPQVMLFHILPPLIRYFCIVHCWNSA